MLVICNGAIKSGSTWLYNVVTRLVELSWPPEHYLTLTNRAHPTVPSGKIAGFLAEGRHKTGHYVSKNHYARPEVRDLLLADDAVLVIDMTRDVRDVLVSAYYDAQRRDGFIGSFEAFYWREGRALIDRLARYHQLWNDTHPQVLVTSFEALKIDFKNEVRRIGRFLGKEPSGDLLEAIAQATQIEHLRKDYEDEPEYATSENAFFRKGEIGDWANHFTPALLADLKKIEHRGLPRFDRAELANRLRRKFARLRA